MPFMRLIACCFLLSLATTLSASEQPPNIVLILTDDQGWSQLSEPMDPRIAESCSSYLETPNINRLASDGVRFTSGYSPAPLCTPTRRSILCGTSAARSGTEFVSEWVPAEHVTIPQALKQADSRYRCAHFGKWGENMISTPEECGYDASDGMTGNVTGGMPKSLGISSGKHGDGPPHFNDNEDPKRTDSVTGSAIDFMREQSGDGHPFYVQVSYYAVHLSVVCREQTLEKYRQKGEPDRGYTQAWAAMLEELDTGVGELLDALDDLNIADNTYVFFTADNGGRGTVPGGADRPTNTPLTGAKHSLYEGGIRVPFLVRGPGIPAGSVCREPVVGYDFLPTFYELAGGDAELSDEIDGTSFAAALLQPDDAALERRHEALFFHRPRRGFSAIRQGDDKLLVFWNASGNVRESELYRVEPNPREENFNIAADEPARVQDLQQRLLDYLTSVDAETKADPVAKPRKKRTSTQRK